MAQGLGVTLADIGNIMFGVSSIFIGHGVLWQYHHRHQISYTCTALISILYLPDSLPTHSTSSAGTGHLSRSLKWCHSNHIILGNDTKKGVATPGVDLPAKPMQCVPSEILV